MAKIWVRRLIGGAAALGLVAAGLIAAALWAGSSQLLHPSWRGANGDLAACTKETETYWGPGCGDLRRTHAVNFEDFRAPALNGYTLPGWLARADANGRRGAKAAVLLVHAGGADRRDMSRYIPYFLARGFDVYAFDLACHGEAPCSAGGLAYGEREAADVQSLYLYAARDHDAVYAMGTSVGAAAILIALPNLPRLSGAVIENPILSFERLITDTPASRPIPGWFLRALIATTRLRGAMDGLRTPAHAIGFSDKVPLLFVHCETDSLVPVAHSRELADAYRGPKTLWTPAGCDHDDIWRTQGDEYRRRLDAFFEANAK